MAATTKVAGGGGETRCYDAGCRWRRRDETMRLRRCSLLVRTGEDGDVAACCVRDREDEGVTTLRTTWSVMVFDGGEL
ncbi:hypothetical protein SESBI_04847 [Sesbania bispinosa]|nr:hypothetical protein SESBI_04847 [Sesbania bispinosa]